MFFSHPIFTLSLSLFFLMDAIGNIPVFISLLKKYKRKKQILIILRELSIALVTIFIFFFSGNFFLQTLGISEETVRIAGGVILFLISLKMIFSPKDENENEEVPKNEPLIVPLAIPLIAGPAILATVMIYARQNIPVLWVISAITIAWAISTIILLAAPFMQKILGEKGINALEKLMGLILILIAIQMFLDGVSGFVLCHKNL